MNIREKSTFVYMYTCVIRIKTSGTVLIFKVYVMIIIKVLLMVLMLGNLAKVNHRQTSLDYA